MNLFQPSWLCRFFLRSLFSRGAYHGSGFLFMVRRPLFARSTWIRLFCHRSADFFRLWGAHCTKRLFLRRGSASFFHPVRFFERYFSSRITAFFHLQGFIESSFFCIMRIERLFFIRCYRHVDFSSVLSFCALRFFKLLLMIDLSLVLSEVLSMWIFL